MAHVQGLWPMVLFHHRFPVLIHSLPSAVGKAGMSVAPSFAMGPSRTNSRVLTRLNPPTMIALSLLEVPSDDQPICCNCQNYSAGIAKIAMPVRAAAITLSPIVISHLRVPFNSTQA